jgi:hypothetical protein
MWSNLKGELEKAQEMALALKQTGHKFLAQHCFDPTIHNHSWASLRTIIHAATSYIVQHLFN